MQRPAGGDLVSRRPGMRSRRFSFPSSCVALSRSQSMFPRRSRCARTSKCASRSPRLLRGEQLEARTVLAAISPLAYLSHFVAGCRGGNTGVSAVAQSSPPTVAKAAGVAGNSTGSVTGKTAALAVLGSDAQGESSLIYTWKVAVARRAAPHNSASTAATRRRTIRSPSTRPAFTPLW